MRAEGDIVRSPSERIDARAHVDTFFAEELMQDAFLRLWERWDALDRMNDPTGYLFRVALNGFRRRRRRATTAIRKIGPVTEKPARPR
jgi:DNA-directed RNA polymerase specialized sigma24 family protein